MYITGQKKDFASRLHQLANDSTAFSSFVTEGNGYLSSTTKQTSGKWEKEARLAKFRYTRSASFLTTAVFNSGVTAGVIQSFSNLKTNSNFGSGQVFDSNRPRYANGVLYLMDNSGMFYILNVATGVDNATVIGSLDLTGQAPFDYVINGTTLYFMAANCDLIVVNAAIPAAPVIVTTVPSEDTNLAPQPAFMYGGYLYVPAYYAGGGGDGGVFIYNLTLPLAPSFVSVWYMDGSGPEWNAGGNWGGGGWAGTCIKDNYLYVLDYFSQYLTGSALMYVVDVADKSSPTLVNTITIPQGTDVVGNFEAWRGVVKGNYLYICDDRNIACYDITSASSPTYVNMAVSDDGDTESVLVIDNTIFWACNATESIVAWDISGGFPVQSARYDTTGLSCSNGLGVDTANHIVYFMGNGLLAQASYT